MKRTTAGNSKAASVISEVRALPSDANIRSVRVGRKTVATLRETDVEALGLAVGRRWTPALASAVERLVTHNAARRAAMGLLSKRGRSRAELTERLTGRGFPADSIRTVVEQVQRDGWLNERVYAEDVVQGTLRRGPAGRRLLQQRLAQRGIAARVAADVTAKALGIRDEHHDALELARHRLGTMGDVEPLTAARRLAGLLARRGFDEQVITDTLDALRLRPDVDSDDGNR